MLKHGTLWCYNETKQELDFDIRYFCYNVSKNIIPPYIIYNIISKNPLLFPLLFHLSFKAFKIFSGVMGRSKILTPMASKMALAMAGVVAIVAGSPIPLAP